MKHLRLLFLLGMAVLALPCRAVVAADLVLIAPGGAEAAATELDGSFERSTGNRIDATFLSGGATRQRALQGENFDVAIEQPPYETIISSGHVIADSYTRLASVPVAIAVRAGAVKPDISTPAAVRKLLVAARSIAYPDASAGAAAGVSFEHTLQVLGIAAEVHGKQIHVRNGAGAMQLLADGKVEVGLTFESEMRNAGIQIVGPLPESISQPTQLAGFVSSGSPHAAIARDLLRYLSSPAAAAVYRANGMNPIQ